VHQPDVHLAAGLACVRDRTSTPAMASSGLTLNGDVWIELPGRFQKTLRAAGRQRDFQRQGALAL